MKTIVLVSLLAGLAWPAVAVAQDATTSTTAGVTLSTDLDSVDELSAHLATSGTVDLATVSDPAKINIVKVSALEASASGNMDSFKTAVTTNAAALTTLRDAVTANTVIVTKLEAEGLKAGDVVAVVHNQADGSITIYVDDSSMTTGAVVGGTMVGGVAVSAEDLPKVQAACDTLAAKQAQGGAASTDTATDAAPSADATTGETDAGIDAATTKSIDLALLTYESCKAAGLVK